MNASRVKVLCGSRAVKNGKGAKGMSTKDIEKFVKEKLPSNLQAEFKRMQKKDRMSLCVLLSKFKNGQSLLQQAATPPKIKKPVKSNDPFEEAARAALANKRTSPKEKGKMNFEITNENGNSNNNGSPNREVQGYSGNSPNEETKRKIVGQRNWAGIRRAEPDPVAKGAKLRGKLKGQMNARLRRLKRTGKLPEGKTMAELLKNEMTKKPKNFKKRSPPRRTSKPPTKLMNFGKAKSEATGKRPTQQSIPAIYKTKGYSANQVRNARMQSNKILTSFNRAGLLPNAGNSKEFEREMETLKKELLNDQLSTMKPAGSKTPEQAKVSFNSTSSAGLNINTELSRIKKMKAANKNATIRRKERIYGVLKKMKPSTNPAYMRPTKLVPYANNGKSPNNSPSPGKVDRGLSASNASIQNLKNKRNRGEKLSSPERKLLNVVNALRK